LRLVLTRGACIPVVLACHMRADKIRNLGETMSSYELHHNFMPLTNCLPDTKQSWPKMFVPRGQSQREF
jgi:hypothetical protein